MTELKTLKDFNTDELTQFYCEQLKQEAIKEVKFAKSSKEGTKGLFGWGIDFLFTKDVIGYIKWKFNLKEEDLKDE